jgi:hypothetical protein
MGWSFPWVSSYGSDFNYDFRVSFTEEQLAAGKADYNYGLVEGYEELPGLSVFYKMREARCSTPIPAMHGASTWSMAPTSSSTLCRKAVMRTASNSRWSGCAGTISIEALKSQ